MNASHARGLCLSALLVVLASCAPARRDAAPASSSATTATVSGAWARSTPAGASAGAVYLTIESEVDDRLTDASVPATVAGAAQMHEMVHSPEGFMTMHRMTSIALPAHQAVHFAPGGMHIMLLQLARPLAIGDSVALTLRFEKSAPLVVVAPVRDE